MLHRLSTTPALLCLLLLAGCRSEKVAFRFGPSHPAAVVSSRIAPATPVAATTVLSSVAASSSPALSPSHRAVSSAKPRPRVRPLAVLRQAAVKAVVKALVPAGHNRTRQGVAATKRLAAEKPSSLEHNSLFLGLFTVAVGVALILLVEGRTLASATLLLNIAHVLLVIGAIAMAIWFVSLVRRASKER